MSSEYILALLIAAGFGLLLVLVTRGKARWYVCEHQHAERRENVWYGK
jgi:hypothetical protein